MKLKSLFICIFKNKIKKDNMTALTTDYDAIFKTNFSYSLQVFLFIGALWSRISLSCLKLSNSGNILKLLVSNDGLKAICGLGKKLFDNTMAKAIVLSIVSYNHSCKVISQKMIEREIDNRGSKPRVFTITLVKEQRADGSWQVNYNILYSNRCIACLRCALTGFERNCPKGYYGNYLI